MGLARIPISISALGIDSDERTHLIRPKDWLAYPWLGFSLVPETVCVLR